METDILIDDLYQTVMNPNIPVNPQYFQQYNLSPQSIQKITEINATLAQQALAIKNLNTPLGKKQLHIQLLQTDDMYKSLKHTFTVIHDLKLSLQDTLKANKTSQSITKYMYIASFILGMALIITAVVFAAMDKTILAIAFGSFGMLDIVAHFIADPPARLQESRSNYAQLTGLTLAWFKETINNDAYIANLASLNPTMLKHFNALSDNYVTNTGKFFKMIEDLAEPQNKKKHKSAKKNTEVEVEK